MTAFWSGWVIALILFNLGITFFLFAWGLRVKVPTQPDGTSGHVWAHGVLRESVRNLPKWWIVMSGLTYVFGIWYFIQYPGFGHYDGKLKWTSHVEEARDTLENRRKLDPVLARFAEKSIAELAHNPSALRYGSRLYADNCAACHGHNGMGNQLIGAPNLTDRDTLYGNDGDTILASINNGRHGVMPPKGGNASLSDDDVTNLTHYVLSLSGSEHDVARAQAGQPKFAMCGACHGAEGKGNPMMGAPNLTDRVWLYGGSFEAIEHSIREGRSGVMPAWNERLAPSEARAVAAWVYSLSNRTSGDY
ncbi:cytochrome-c oxidase, cbb3-type subunit III [Sinimarinibacterium sp. NLF-5-8]|uniref:cytochrome-c oxidase, cbb3-type subunit III n=1 Tax=Sinimarinibacterium sp. NLF-5-8 TaxID=2698684 RepID=UPI00137BC2E6|nr:cytochrome-c oxidase, cbb3-type subunit III [Sinimarinibacterium sp. NLF-5-8]QHS10831.1 cytochrome-c oxidase, cbb3-type subunit III [Sinimarinibacterium sp. NLF-5-8]